MIRARATGRRAPRRVSTLTRAARLFIAAALLVFSLVAILSQRGTDEVRSGTASVGDGDSITIDGERIRLLGIDAPELRQTCRRDGAEYACGEQAREVLRRLAAGSVECTGKRCDRYRRLLAVCVSGNVELNRTLVEDGWAVAYGAYEDAEALARSQGRGLWAGEFERPRQWRVLHGEMADIEIDLVGRLLDWIGSFFSRG